VPFNLTELMDRRRGENFQLHEQYLNPQLAKVIKTLDLIGSTSAARAVTSTTTRANGTWIC